MSVLLGLALPLAVAWLVWRLLTVAFDVAVCGGRSHFRGTPGLADFAGLRGLIRFTRGYHRLYDVLLAWWQDVGFKTFQNRLPFQQRFYFIADPDCIEHITKTNFDNYVRGAELNAALNDMLGGGIFNSDGHAWYVQRKTASNIFNVRNFRDHFVNVFREEVQMLVEILDKHAADGTAVDIHDLFHRFTMDSFTKIAFGKDLHVLEKYLAGDKQPVPFAAAFDEAQRITDARIFNPLWRLTEHMDGSHATMQRCIKTMDDFAYAVVRERRDDPQSSEYNDLLSRFMNVQADAETGRGYSDKELRDIVMNMVIAGRDTTAQALSWTIYNLDQHADIVAEIRKEVRDIFSDSASLADQDAYAARFSGGSSCEAPAYQHIKRMTYTHAVFSETLRLHPSVPKQAKTAVAEDILPDGTIIPAGTIVAWSSWCMGRMPQLWGANALQFDPSRFVNTQHSPFKYPAFNMGPRLCLGMNMAYLEAVLALAVLLENFDLRVVDRAKVHYQNGLTLPMRDGLRVWVGKRDGSTLGGVEG